ncbi:Luciferase-like monooxygenase [Gluconacetobacter diazotrophicus PA1 5]|uniref:Luciferase-like monooxygenase n=2 Tax=Gluconacetobacter diazotrophicus TaxID=33996 RepID=A9HSA0_GLUDA|nr:LLM class flavin-dependent oxidoreductase [Gluconacetobacter diazotrophicus]ACI52989.1 Luciferase-like monooxygenase [Gluconacetobacter diazotrophicus PA1 5]MBB2157682.1 LLM class flavin-dependent oxidoreductase [Gluconacetobacter diazotrophicus]TWA98164.1 luciferase family oxidoreductase group 1 [Gluconacetobacter diazotrophicus]CAP57048.1 putative oxidoreductase protein [Gluconacetobacter diazotrophicus PA1 5]
MIPLSILDLSLIVRGSDAAVAFRNSLDLARHAESLDFHRYWVAEHHAMPAIASAATSVLIGHLAAGTSRIRVGAGGIMLPNHAPLTIAEQFGTLESLFPGRIDLGLGRAPGSDQETMRALRRDPASADRFPQDVVELLHYFDPPAPGQRVRAVPGAGLDIPVWLLGSSLFSAHLAAQLGLPFAFASHFAPDQMDDAVMLYRQRFTPSARLARPYVMLGLNVVAADTDAEARVLFTSHQQQFVALRRGMPGQFPPPVASTEGLWTPMEQAGIDRALACAVVGGPATLRAGLRAFIDRHQPDELIIVGAIHDHAARLRSFSLAAEAWRDLAHA